jgi:hypothetical protein
LLAATGLTPQLINPETPSDERGVAPAIYGLVVCSATLAAAAVSGQLSFVAVGVLVTGVVYWVAASHANVLARHAVRQMPLDWSEIRAILSQGWPMVSASFIPLGMLLLMGALVPQSLPQSMSPWPLPPWFWCGLDGPPR